MAIVLDGSNLTTSGVLNSAVAQNSTSGTYIDFTGIPAGTKRITISFNGVSTNAAGSYGLLVRLGSGGTIPITGYVSYTGAYNNGSGYGTGSNTTGFAITMSNGNSSILYGHVILTLINNNTWVQSHNFGALDGSSQVNVRNGGGVSPVLSGALDTVRITTTGGTDTFDAGSINILYE